MEVAANPNTPEFSGSLTIVGIIGFIAAATLGSIAWYNSKRPMGWKDKERPDFVPKIEQE
nr:MULTISPECIES: hypothetical protein [unclassified Coleofasciculus]